MKTYKQFILEASNRELQRLMSKPPGSHTEAEKKILLDNGLDDFVRGGKTASPVGDLAMLGATFAAVKGAPMIGKAINTGLGAYSAYQTAQKLKKGDYKGAGVEALGMIPGGKYVAKGVSKIPAVANLINKGNKAQRFAGRTIRTTTGLAADSALLGLPTERNKLINKGIDKVLGTGVAKANDATSPANSNTSQPSQSSTSQSSTSQSTPKKPSKIDLKKLPGAGLSIRTDLSSPTMRTKSQAKAEQGIENDNTTTTQNPNSDAAKRNAEAQQKSKEAEERRKTAEAQKKKNQALNNKLRSDFAMAG